MAPMGGPIGLMLTSIFESINQHPELEGIGRRERWELAQDVQLIGRTIMSMRAKNNKK